MSRRIVAILSVSWLLAIPRIEAVGADSNARFSFSGIGVIGDSYSDEYAFYSPDRATARNWVEILDRARGIPFGSYTDSSRGEPRNQGFAFNWARSDAETATMIRDGQHKGLAAQVASGQVGIVVVFAGGNDFIHALQSPNPDDALRRALPRAVANYRTIVDTVRDARPDVRVLLLTVPDIMELPEFKAKVRSGRLPEKTRDLCRATVHAFNLKVRDLATHHDRTALLDLEFISRMAIPLGQGKAVVGGKVLDKEHPANAPAHLFLADERHMGTYGQGVFAKLIVDTLNIRFRTGIPTLSYQEIYGLAHSSDLLQRPTRLAASE